MKYTWRVIMTTKEKKKNPKIAKKSSTQKKYVWLLIAFAVLFIACESATSPSPSTNTVLNITSLLANKTDVTPGEVVLLMVDYEYSGSDSVEIQWSSNQGKLVHTEYDKCAQWTAPEVYGYHTLSVTASDGVYTSQAFIRVRVYESGIDPLN